MNMHDNDIDALFRSKLDELEVEPSAKVWGNISQELHGDKRRKTLIPILRIAASVAVLIAAGLFFLPKHQKAGQTQPVNRVAKNNPVKTPVAVPQTTAIPQANTVNTTAQVVQAVISQTQQQLGTVPKVKVRQATNSAVNVTQQPVINPDKTDAIANAQPATVLAAVTNKIIVTKPVVPDAQTSLKPESATLDVITQPATVLAAANIPDDNSNKPASPAKKHKARGFGGILNAMIGVVDKREDKIIEFTDTDEGDTVTGINLGIVKIKKQK